ncbi:MAG: YraN family protein [Slackia sp.]|nr:YraN family protein [Slackia sp.]
MEEKNRGMSTKERIVRQGDRGSAEPAVDDLKEDAGLCDEEAVSDETAEGASASRLLGMRGEEAACRFLKRRGYIVLERNWTCPAGEADIVAQDEDGSLVFVEVKTRSNLEAGLPAESVTPRKRARYERIAGYFLADYDGEECRVRFDVIALLVLGNGRALVRHYVNAFGSGQ